MKLKIYLRACISVVLAGAMLVPGFVFAQSSRNGGNASGSLNQSSSQGGSDNGINDNNGNNGGNGENGDNRNATTTISASKIASAKAKADKEIDRRVTSLTDLNTRIQAMQIVTDAFKQSLAANVQTEISAFGALKAKIDADTDATTLRADIQSITASYRTFALLLPQVRIAAAADRAVTLITMMSTLGAKLQVRIASAQSAGNNTSALVAATVDLQAKLTDANSQAQTAVSVSAALTPDGGDTTKMAANNAALKTAKGDIQAANDDLQAARKDIQVILKGLKALEPNDGNNDNASTTQRHD